MKKEDFISAIHICEEHHSTKLTINLVPEGQVVSNAQRLVIHECVPAVINKLKDAGYMIGLESYGMYVDKI